MTAADYEIRCEREEARGSLADRRCADCGLQWFGDGPLCDGCREDADEGCDDCDDDGPEPESD